MKNILYTITLAMLLLACSDENKSAKKHLPVSGGKLNNMSIVISNELWKTEVGDAARKVFAQPIYGLPQDEPTFSLRQMVPEAFHNFVKKSRVFVQIEMNDSITKLQFIKDIYATPQLGILVRGKNSAEIIALLHNNATKMRNKIKEVELAYKLHTIQRNPKETNVLQEVFNIDMDILYSYRVATKTENFMWLRKDVPNGDLNVLLYELPYNTIKRDSLTIRNLVKVRDSIGKAHIPAAVEGSYMITEKAFSPFLTTTTIANLPAIETRGIWDAKGDWAAGPFVNYVIDDKANNRQLVLEGFVYYPNSEKRDYMFELEAMIKSLKVF